MPNKILAQTCGVAMLTLGFALAATPVYAGFEWVSPGDSASGQQPPVVLSQPSPTAPLASAPQVATSAPEVISPVIISGDTTKQPAPPSPFPAAGVISGTAPVSLAAPVSQQTLPSSYPAPAPAPAPSSVALTPASMPAAADSAASAPTSLAPSSANGATKNDLATATISVSPSSSEEVVPGFASQVPLALALRQILPVGYSFSIDPGVDMETLVSYKGGRPWRETLKDMLAQVHLEAREQGAEISITQGGSVVPVAGNSAPLPLQPSPNASRASGYLVAPATAIAAPSVMPAVNVSPADGWSAERGDTLRKVLTEWCHKAGVELQWLAEYDYPVEASAHFSSGFEDAVRNLLAGFDTARPQPIGELHTNSSAGQMVLVVQARGNNYSN
ncbi:MAG: TcpQ domain-containing protein [Alphaproteobacteria bacterium]|nr:TcpQ domain-containing protein [Alphaproteobacteria bacterium]